MVKAGYLWQSLQRCTFTSFEVNGNKMVKRLLGISCLKGDTLAVFLQAASSSHCAHPSSRLLCSTSPGAAVARAWVLVRGRSAGRGVGTSGEQAWTQQHLPSCSSVLPVLASVDVSSMKERLCVGYPSLVLLACVVFD